jgi:HSP20 family protein
MDMALIPYNPFELLRRDFPSLPGVSDWMDDAWFGTHFGNPGRVRVDVRENPKEVIVSAEIPGLEKKEDVQISVHDTHLHLSGKIERATEQQDENFHRTERFYGRFERTVSLPCPVVETGAKATYRNGVLEVRLPKAEHRQGKQIDVEFH